MSTKRRQFSSAEKTKIALLAIKGDMTVSEIASKHSVHVTQINKWKKAALAYLPEAFTNRRNQVKVDHETELRNLYEQIGRLKVENEFLKKKCDLFAS